MAYGPGVVDLGVLLAPGSVFRKWSDPNPDPDPVGILTVKVILKYYYSQLYRVLF